MKTRRFTTHLNTEHVITIIDLINELKKALRVSYHAELEDYQHQRWAQPQHHENEPDDR